MEVSTKFNVGDLVFVFVKGAIYKCRISRIVIETGGERILKRYYLSHLTAEHNVVEYKPFNEESLASTLGEIMSTIQVYE